MGPQRAWVSQSWSPPLRFILWSFFFRQDGLDKVQRWLLDEGYWKESLKNKPQKLRMEKWILMAEEKRNWMLWVMKELVLAWSNEGVMKELVVCSWMEVTPTPLGKEGWKSIAKGWVYLASGACNALSIRWASVSFRGKERSSQFYQGSWGRIVKEKLESFPHPNALCDKRRTSGDEWTGTPV